MSLLTAEEEEEKDCYIFSCPIPDSSPPKSPSSLLCAIVMHSKKLAQNVKGERCNSVRW